MPLDKKRLMNHLSTASRAKPTMPKSPATPAKPASIRAAEKIEQDVMKATGAEITNHMNNLDSSPDVKVVAEQSLSNALS